jgi:hypothetical protein
MNATNCLAGGVGIFAAGFLKASHGLDKAFAGISLLMLCAASLTLTGYLFFLQRDLTRKDAAAV